MIHVVPTWGSIGSLFGEASKWPSHHSLAIFMPVASYYRKYLTTGVGPRMGEKGNVRVTGVSPQFLEQRRSILMELLRTACLHSQTAKPKEKGPQVTPLSPLLGPLMWQRSSIIMHCQHVQGACYSLLFHTSHVRSSTSLCLPTICSKSV